jgi:hypothetical protein
VGFLSGKIEVCVVKYRRKYYTTNRLILPAPEVRTLYRIRQQTHHIALCLVAYLIIERERFDQE